MKYNGHTSLSACEVHAQTQNGIDVDLKGNKQAKRKSEILSCIRDQRTKSREAREQLKSSKTKEVAYSYRYECLWIFNPHSEYICRYRQSPLFSTFFSIPMLFYFLFLDP